jgi:hypothetical protein
VAQDDLTLSICSPQNAQTNKRISPRYRAFAIQAFPSFPLTHTRAFAIQAFPSFPLTLPEKGTYHMYILNLNCQMFTCFFSNEPFHLSYDIAGQVGMFIYKKEHH